MASVCCRLCLLHGPDLLPIFKLTVNSNRANIPVISALSQLIISYLSIEPVIGDITEAYVCSECRNTIAKWHWFRESCVQNDGVYQKMARDPGKADLLGQIDEYQDFEVKQEQEIEIGEHKLSEDVYTEPQDEGQIGNVGIVEVKQEKEDKLDEEELIEPMDPPPREELKKKISPRKIKKGGPVVKPKPERFPLPEGDKRSRVRKCTLCGKEVKDMANHMRMHNQDRCYQCPHCPMNFHIKSNLKKHVNVHTKEIKYNCPVCEKLFLRSDTLKTHMRIHSDNRPFKCPDCPKAFRFVSGLSEHRKTHKKAPDVQCTGCDRKFYSKHHMYEHAAVHLPGRHGQKSSELQKDKNDGT